MTGKTVSNTYRKGWIQLQSSDGTKWYKPRNIAGDGLIFKAFSKKPKGKKK